MRVSGGAWKHWGYGNEIIMVPFMTLGDRSSSGVWNDLRAKKLLFVFKIVSKVRYV